MQTHIKNKLKCFGIETMSCDKEKIISLFIANVKGKKYGESEKSHCGDEGQWLEKCMGIHPNGKNIPDINGFEQKKESIEKKFNAEGFYMLKKNKKGEYDKICFGQKITFELWIEQFKQEKIYYDGYSSLNGRWRGCFRAKKHWWNDLITEEYS